MYRSNNRLVVEDVTNTHLDLVYIIDGEAEVSISGKPSSVKQGEMIIMPANEPHSLKAVTNFKMLLVMIKA